MANIQKKVVSPGDRLGVIEEYMPGSGTYEEDGKIVSSMAGLLELDTKSRTVGVRGGRKAPIPEIGDIVEGVVVSMKEDVALVKIVGIRGKKSLTGDFSAQLHVSQVSKEYTKSIFDAVNLNDRILAKVTTSWSPYQLSTEDENLGVIYSTCSKCGSELVLKKGRLCCDNDKTTEKKKISKDYLVREG
ncbi:MAG: exosome complex RNA-binding protein Csl4 [Candidatus Verstraetearchaeota archaeon]|nr:exosome complex RNA-binding protein Csl4 [Candidatus Verstraetearchaeota archaeon]